MSREERHSSCRKLARGPWILGKTTNRPAVAADYLANRAAVAADYLANRAAVAADYSTNRAAVAADYSVFIPVCLPWGIIPSGSEAQKKKVLKRYRDMLWLYAKRCESYAEHEAGKWTAS